jgi:hypothetical protein
MKTSGGCGSAILAHPEVNNRHIMAVNVAADMEN